MSPVGGKSWRFKYRFLGKEKQLAIGPFPLIGVSEARDARDQAKRQLLRGLDPSAEKKRTKAARALAHLDSFERTARAWQEQKAPMLAPRYAKQVLDRLEADVFPAIGSLPIGDVTAPMVLELVRAIEKRGAREMAHRVRMHVSDVFVWAIASGLCEQDPAAVIRKALVPTDSRRRRARRSTRSTGRRASLRACWRSPRPGRASSGWRSATSSSSWTGTNRSGASRRAR